MSNKEIFSDIEYLVETTNLESLSIWKEWHIDNKGKHAFITQWNEKGGPRIDIGFIDKRPICIALNKVIINGHKIGFWEATSELVDYKMINMYFDEFAKDKYGKNIRRTDSWNISRCFIDLEMRKNNE